MCNTFVITREQQEKGIIFSTAVDCETTTSAFITKSHRAGRPLFGIIERPADFVDDDARSLRPTRLTTISDERAKEISRRFGPTGKYTLLGINDERGT